MAHQRLRAKFPTVIGHRIADGQRLQVEVALDEDTVTIKVITAF